MTPPIRSIDADDYQEAALDVAHAGLNVAYTSGKRRLGPGSLKALGHVSQALLHAASGAWDEAVTSMQEARDAARATQKRG